MLELDKEKMVCEDYLSDKNCELCEVLFDDLLNKKGFYNLVKNPPQLETGVFTNSCAPGCTLTPEERLVICSGGANKLVQTEKNSKTSLR